MKNQLAAGNLFISFFIYNNFLLIDARQDTFSSAGICNNPWKIFQIFNTNSLIVATGMESNLNMVNNVGPVQSPRNRIFELLGITDERDPLTRFLDTAKFVPDSLAIVTLIETRDDEKYEKPEAGELLEEWNLQLDNIIAEMKLIAHDFKQVTCHVDVIYPERII